jgi:hypothetical protein
MIACGAVLFVSLNYSTAFAKSLVAKRRKLAILYSAVARWNCKCIGKIVRRRIQFTTTIVIATAIAKIVSSVIKLSLWKKAVN